MKGLQGFNSDADAAMGATNNNTPQSVVNLSGQFQGLAINSSISTQSPANSNPPQSLQETDQISSSSITATIVPSAAQNNLLSKLEKAFEAIGEVEAEEQADLNKDEQTISACNKFNQLYPKRLAESYLKLGYAFEELVSKKGQQQYTVVDQQKEFETALELAQAGGGQEKHFYEAGFKVVDTLFQQTQYEDALQKALSIGDTRGIDCNNFQKMIFRIAEQSIDVIVGKRTHEGAETVVPDKSQASLEHRIEFLLEVLFKASNNPLFEKVYLTAKSQLISDVRNLSQRYKESTEKNYDIHLKSINFFLDKLLFKIVENQGVKEFDETDVANKSYPQTEEVQSIVTVFGQASEELITHLKEFIAQKRAEGKYSEILSTLLRIIPLLKEEIFAKKYNADVVGAAIGAVDSLPRQVDQTGKPYQDLIDELSKVRDQNIFNNEKVIDQLKASIAKLWHTDADKRYFNYASKAFYSSEAVNSIIKAYELALKIRKEISNESSLKDSNIFKDSLADWEIRFAEMCNEHLKAYEKAVIHFTEGLKLLGAEIIPDGIDPNNTKQREALAVRFKVMDDGTVKKDATQKAKEDNINEKINKVFNQLFTAVNSFIESNEFEKQMSSRIQSLKSISVTSKSTSSAAAQEVKEKEEDQPLKLSVDEIKLHALVDLASQHILPFGGHVGSNASLSTKDAKKQIVNNSGLNNLQPFFKKLLNLAKQVASQTPIYTAFAKQKDKGLIPGGKFEESDYQKLMSVVSALNICRNAIKVDMAEDSLYANLTKLMKLGEVLRSQQKEGEASFHITNAQKQFEQFKAAAKKKDTQAVEAIIKEFELALRLRSEVTEENWKDKWNSLSDWYKAFADVLKHENIGRYKDAVEYYAKALKQRQDEPNPVASNLLLSEDQELSHNNKTKEILDELINAANKFKSVSGRKLTKEQRLDLLKDFKLFFDNNIHAFFEGPKLNAQFEDAYYSCTPADEELLKKLAVKNGFFDEVKKHATDLLWYDSPKLKAFIAQKNIGKVPGDAINKDEHDSLSLAYSLLKCCKKAGLEMDKYYDHADKLLVAEKARNLDPILYKRQVEIHAPKTNIFSVAGRGLSNITQSIMGKFSSNPSGTSQDHFDALLGASRSTSSNQSNALAIPPFGSNLGQTNPGASSSLSSSFSMDGFEGSVEVKIPENLKKKTSRSPSPSQGQGLSG